MAAKDTDTDDVDPSWLSWKIERSDRFCYSQYCCDRPYLEFEVPVGVKRVRRVVFTTISHDQGFSDTGGDAKGTYEHSYSWFEAVIVTPSGHDRVERRRLQSNLHADFQKRQHINVWDDSRGDTSIKQFLRAIQAGDSIAIVPKTRHVGWLNFVYHAEMQIYGEKEDPADAPISALTKKVRSFKIGSSEDDERTVYRPLDESSDEIRVIVIEPGVFDDDLVCELKYAKLNDSDHYPFEALSYCWGDMDNARSITLINTADAGDVAENAVMLVTANLYDALRYVRRDDGRARTIWADAVCINQVDLLERSRQVALMPQIYKKAINIIVWLGQANESVITAIQNAKLYLERYEKCEKHPDNFEDVQHLHKPLLDGGSLLVDNTLFEYEYFRRTWVLQEVFNARSVTVHCGAYQIGWAPILRMNQCLLNSMLIPNPIGKHTLPALFAGLFEIEEGISHPLSLNYKRLPGQLGILDVFLRGLDLDASDVRDKIFALLTFGEETSDLNTLPTLIKPDYTKSTQQVFADFTRWWISKHHSLEILSALQVALGRTWQPTTNRLSTIESLGRASWSLWHTGKSFWRQGTLGLASDCSYSAAKDTRPDEALLESPDDPLVLSLAGHQITSITAIGLYPYYRMYAHVRECKQPEACPQNALHAAYESIFDPIDERGTWRYGLQHQVPELQAKRVQNTPEQMLSKLTDHFYAHPELLRRTGAIQCHGTPFFYTEHKQHGLCPPAARKDDIVVVLHGGKVPYLLRQRTDSVVEGRKEYYLIGECYLEGYMHGLAIDENTDGDGKMHSEVFHLV